MSLNLETFSKKIIVLVVEGDSDAEYFRYAINSIRKKSKSLPKIITISDVTSNKNCYLDIDKLIDLFIETELTNPENKIDADIAKNIIGIYHVIDIDNAFISEDKIIENKTADGFLYSRNSIECKSVERVKERNEIKVKGVENLLNKRKSNICGSECDYKLYFFSINIDDFFNDNALNLTNTEKANYSSAFSDNMLNLSDDDRIRDFYNMIVTTNPKDFPSSYEDGWKYVMENNNCLKKVSNTFLIIEDLLLKLQIDFEF